MRIFNDAVALERTDVSTPGIVPVIVRLIYGVGNAPPWIERAMHDDARLLVCNTGSISLSATQSGSTFNVTEGMLLDISQTGSQQTAAGETSTLGGTLILNPTGVVVTPDSQINNNVATAGVDTAQVFCLWRNLVVPRGVTSIEVRVSRFKGNAVTNNIGATAIGITTYFAAK